MRLLFALAAAGLFPLCACAPEAATSGRALVATESTNLPAQLQAPSLVIVPYQVQSVQRAVDLVADGGVVWLAPGSYEETVVVTGKSVHLVGSGRAFTTLLGPEGQGAVVRYGPNGGGSLRFLTLRGGEHGVAGALPEPLGVTIGVTNLTNEPPPPPAQDTEYLDYKARVAPELRPAPLELKRVSIRAARLAIYGDFSRFAMSDVVVRGAQLDGVRLIGADDVNISDLTVEQSGHSGMAIGNFAGAPGCKKVFNGLKLYGNAGGGLLVQGGACPVEIRGGQFEENGIVGIALFSVGDALIDGSFVSRTLPRSDGNFGDGVFVWSSNVRLVGALVTQNERAGAAVFGCLATGNPASLSMAATKMWCNGFEIDLEHRHLVATPEGGCGETSSATLLDAGGNLCLKECPPVAAPAWCKAHSEGFAPVPAK